jgi:hypothetical protein
MSDMYFIMQVSVSSGDYAKLFVPRSIDKESLGELRQILSLQLRAIENSIDDEKQP